MSKEGQISEQEALFLLLENRLAKFSSFKAILPANYPRHRKFEVSPAKMSWYRDNRTTHTWSHFNLPFVLYNGSNIEADPKVNELTTSILQTFDDFSSNFISLPGAKKTLEPLWTSAWDIKDPRLWSILSECFLALLLKSRGRVVKGFGIKIGKGPQNSDIQINLDGKTAHIDIECENLTKVIQGSRFKFRKLLEGRAFSKMRKKFENLPPGELGVVACIYSVESENYRRFASQGKWTTRPIFRGYLQRNPFTQVYWIVGGRIPPGNFGFRIVDRATVTNEPGDHFEVLMGLVYDSWAYKVLDRLLYRIFVRFAVKGGRSNSKPCDG